MCNCIFTDVYILTSDKENITLKEKQNIGKLLGDCTMQRWNCERLIKD